MDKNLSNKFYANLLALILTTFSGSVWSRTFALWSNNTGFFNPKYSFYIDVFIGGVFGFIIGLIICGVCFLALKNPYLRGWKIIIAAAFINGFFPIWLLVGLTQNKGIEKVAFAIWFISIMQIFVGGISGWLISKNTV